MLPFHFPKRTRKAMTSVGSRKEYEAFVSFGAEETTTENPFPMRLIICKHSYTVDHIISIVRI
jgi:tRNA U55 pseudouridine synthase TruB